MYKWHEMQNKSFIGDILLFGLKFILKSFVELR